jgi:glycosyltransferase involved in cell wall biosynthesis
MEKVIKIIVFDVPAVSSGALSVLQDFFEDVFNTPNLVYSFIFVVSKPILKSNPNIKVIRFPWIKKSWFHRTFFDLFIAPNLIRKYKVNLVFSLQNTVIPFTNLPQILYVHNSLPFIDYKFKFYLDPFLWVYQNLIGVFIYRSIKKSNLVFAQTKWMKEFILKKKLTISNKIIVVPPKIHITNVHKFSPENFSKKIVFFYPATSIKFKNHSLIVDACKELEKLNLDYEVVFTIKGNENKNAKKLKKDSIFHNLKIKFIGPISREEVFRFYSKSILIFPSYVESSPLPLSEAMFHNSYIFSSKLPFSLEILNGYNNAYYFDHLNHLELSNLMKRAICDDLSYDLNLNVSSGEVPKLLNVLLNEVSKVIPSYE